MKPYLRAFGKSLLKYELLSTGYAYLYVIWSPRYPAEKLSNHFLRVSIKLVQAINEEDKLAFVVDSVLLYNPVIGLLNLAFCQTGSYADIWHSPIARGTLPQSGQGIDQECNAKDLEEGHSAIFGTQFRASRRKIWQRQAASRQTRPWQVSQFEDVDRGISLASTFPRRASPTREICHYHSPAN
jgi:hypothetical protein